MLALCSALFVTLTSAQPFRAAESTVRGMIARYAPVHSNDFVLESLPPEKGHSVFEIESRGTKIVLRASDGVALASCFNWYLKHVAQCQVSTRGDQLKLPRHLPGLAKTIRRVSPYQVVNYLNYCTFCYTSAFWSWSQWEREIDMMAMSGVTTPLMIVGNEIVWERVLKRLGYSQSDIAKFIPGCAFTAWWLMGNQEGEGGPVPESLIQSESKLAQRILSRMRAYGMQPILQGFNGVVPTSLPKYLPGANIVDQGKWAGGYQRPSVLSPLDPQFSHVAQLWYEEHAKVYGKSNYYGGDLFHEGGRTAGLDLAQCAKAVQREMRRNNPQAKWVLQGWSGNPPRKLLEATDPDHIVVEYIQSYPQEATIQDYSGRPWTFCMVNTFGGHETLGGSLPMVAQLPSHLNVVSNKHNVGIGILDEGLDTNPAVYDLFSDMVWQSKDASVSSWAKDYARRRYGTSDPNAEKFWTLMGTDLLGHQAENLLCARPRFGITSTSSWGDDTLTHDLGLMLQAGSYLLASRAKFAHQATYQSDCVELFRQLFNDYGVQIYQQLSDAYMRKDADAFAKLSNELLLVLTDCDRIYSAGEHTLLGKWIADARAKGTSKAEKDLMERNARQLITLWTPNQTDLTDYAYRQWGGLTRDYYLPRWQAFLKRVAASLSDPSVSLNANDDSQWESWVKSTALHYPSGPSGDPVTTATNLWASYHTKFEAGVAYWQGKKDEAKRWSWTLSGSSKHSQTLQWDITEKLKSIGAGQIHIAIEYQSGNNAIIVTQVELQRKTKMAVDGTRLSIDVHAGRSGVVTKDNVYVLDAGVLDPHAQYLVLISASGDGGNDSHGRVVISK